jgi:hypothetical protein
MAKKARQSTPRPSLMKVGDAYGLADPMGSLFEKYDVPYRDYEQLVWELAGKYEEGFKPSKAGRPREMAAWQFEELVTFFARRYRSGRSLREMAAKIKENFPDSPPSMETIRKDLAKARAVAEKRIRERRIQRLARALAG